jgi:tRNA threonylcarbamoyladenosine biosynthesis protein TsaB
MKILAIDSSATAASAAILDDGRILGEFYIHTKLTHSQTLMPMVDALLKNAAIEMEEIDAFAVSTGPGSFTGVRIGVAAVKGMAFAADKPCVPVSTLEAMAWNLAFTEATVYAVMDARCQQVYQAAFQVGLGKVIRLSEDRAVKIDELSQNLIKERYPVFLVGDGAQLCYNMLSGNNPKLQLTPEIHRFQRASGVAFAALEKFSAGVTLRAEQLMPMYLRLPQAERELKQRIGNG